MGQEAVKTCRVTQHRSVAGRSSRLKATMKALGLGKIGASRVLPVNPATVGMLKKVEHLIVIESI
jgi:large subunit ribosomal protein L30